MSQALYRKYRSKRLSEIVGQDHVTDLLSRALTQQKTAHAYLLTGPRGTGKTSVARILAHEINQLPYTDESEHLDIIEIDAASNNGVDDVRDLREKALIAPSQASKKVYIIDEVHMLSKPAFNALLKLMEEPPAHVVFILATTDVDKVPDTIMSRTQRYHFRLIDTETVAKHLATIAKAEKIAIEPDALMLIAERGGGSFRDSISLLDQLQHSGNGKTITRQDIEQALGLATQQEVSALGDALTARDATAIIAALQAIEQRGVSAVAIASQLHYWITPQLATAPHLAQHLEGILRVAKSHHPSTTLLVTLLEGSHHTAPQPAAQTTPASSAPSTPPKPVAKTVATTATAPKVELTATPADIAAVKPTAAEEALPTNKTAEAPQPSAKAAPANTPKPVATKPVSATTKQPAAPAAEAPTAPAQPANPDGFDWDVITAYAAEHKDECIGLVSLLTKCTPELAGTTLTLYAGNKFNKNKLDSPKNRAILGKMLAETGAGGLDIETLATAPPPKDEQAAKVAAIMGGGEEVDV